MCYFNRISTHNGGWSWTYMYDVQYSNQAALATMVPCDIHMINDVYAYFVCLYVSDVVFGSLYVFLAVPIFPGAGPIGRRDSCPYNFVGRAESL